MIERGVVLVLVLIIGAMLGRVGAARAARELQPPDAAAGFPPGLVLVTAPFCGRCTTIRGNLDQLGATVSEVSVFDDTAMVRAFDIRTAPTLLNIGNDGREKERLHGAPTLSELEEFVRRAEAQDR